MMFDWTFEGHLKIQMMGVISLKNDAAVPLKYTHLVKQHNTVAIIRAV